MLRRDNGENQPLMKDLDSRDRSSDEDGDGGDVSSSATAAVIAVDERQPRPSGAMDNNDGAADDNHHPDAPIGRDAQLELDETSSRSDPPTPRFLQDEYNWKRWKWVPYPARRVIKAVAKWSRGPPDAHPYRIRPLFPLVQEYPLWLVKRFLPRFRYKAWLLFFYFSIWLIAFVLVKRQESVATDIAGWGSPVPIGCGVTYWTPGNGCGLDGNDCRPFNGSGFPFKCSANCESYHVLNPRAVGDQEVIYRPMVIGGPGGAAGSNATYRGDSFICGAAIHAGIISNTKGGCGVVSLVGQQQDFASSKRNGIDSVGFDSYFPLSFRFVDNVTCTTSDMRWNLLALSVVMTSLLSIFTASPALFFFPIFTIQFWTVGMALDQPSASTTADLFSNILGKYLPAMFCAWVMFDIMGIKRTLTGLTAQFEKTILWLGACWVGAMTNYTLDFIPINRLTGHDLQQQPGAKAALAIIVIVLAGIIATQVWFFRQEGRFIKYIKIYAVLVLTILIALSLPGLNLRIHHYILALLLLPGTSMQTRPCLLYQGILVGLFINGIARWGFDSVLQTDGALQGDAQKGSALPSIQEPIINWANVTNGVSNITFNWKPAPTREWDGISVLVNDVERFRSYFDDEIAGEDEFVWMRNTTLDLPEYFRFAFMDGSNSGDYTKAGKWTADGEWVEMKSGPSKFKERDGR